MSHKVTAILFSIMVVATVLGVFLQGPMMILSLMEVISMSPGTTFLICTGIPAAICGVFILLISTLGVK